MRSWRSWPGASTGWFRPRRCAQRGSRGRAFGGGCRRGGCTRSTAVSTPLVTRHSAGAHTCSRPSTRVGPGRLRVTARLGPCTASCGRAASRSPRPGASSQSRASRSTAPARTADRTVVAAVPITSVARTLVDLADVLTEERLAKAVHQAEILRVFDLRAVEEALARRAGPKRPASTGAGARRLPARAALPAQRGRAEAQAAVRSPRPSPAAVQRSTWPATRSMSTGPKRASPSRWTARRLITPATPSTRTEGGTGPSRRRASRWSG